MLATPKSQGQSRAESLPSVGRPTRLQQNRDRAATNSATQRGFPHKQSYPISLFLDTFWLPATQICRG